MWILRKESLFRLKQGKVQERTEMIIPQKRDRLSCTSLSGSERIFHAEKEATRRRVLEYLEMIGSPCSQSAA